MQKYFELINLNNFIIKLKNKKKGKKIAAQNSFLIFLLKNK